MYQKQQTVHRQKTTSHLAQTMTLLSMTAEELGEKISSELAANPALELLDERRCPGCGRLLHPREICPTCSQPKQPDSQDPIVFISPRDDFFMGTSMTAEEQPEDNLSAAIEDLPTYVLRQIAPELPSGDRALAAFILTHLDDDGLLTITPLEVAQYHHILPSRVQAIIAMIQHADPIGVGSANSQQAMLVQLDSLEENGPVPPLARKVLTDCMSLLSRHQYVAIAHQLHEPIKQVEETAHFIGANLNPFPGRSHWGDERDNVKVSDRAYHRPDIIINHLNNNPQEPLVVEIIMPLAGTLRVDPRFRSAIKEVKEEKVEDWKSDVERASLFVKCLQQRNHTMERLLARIVVLQREFIDNGEGDLKPITRASLAKELEVHESTISRAVSNKAIQLPSGRIIPFSKFFDRSLHIRTALQQIIAQEKEHLSDTELAELLKKEGFFVARRTVAKYRAMEGILPAHLRQKHTSRQ
jgi:RNA polymerase sigma-54 factor